MKRIYLFDNELKAYPLFYNKRSQESSILDYSPQEIIKLFKYVSDNKLYTLELMEKYLEDFKLIPELLVHKAYVSNHISVLGLLIDKGYDFNLNDYAATASFHDLILVLKNIGKALLKLEKIRIEEHKLTTFFIGDIHEKNILVNPITKNIQFIDLDSCKIDDNFPFLAKYLRFQKTYLYVKKQLWYKYPSNYQ